MKAILSAVALSALVSLSACGGSSGGSVATSTAPANTVNFETTSGGYPPGTTFDKVETAVAEYVQGNTGHMIQIMLANTTVPEKIMPWPEIPEKGAAVSLDLYRKVGEKITTGVYTYDGAANEDMRGIPSVFVPNKGMVTFGRTTGQVEVTSLTADRIAGTYNYTDEKSKLSGKFDAKIINPLKPQ